jgi:hypothetical protein
MFCAALFQSPEEIDAMARQWLADAFIQAPELPTLVLLVAGLVGLSAYARWERK